MAAKKPVNRLPAVADLSFFEGEPGFESDPEEAHKRRCARTHLWVELAALGVDVDQFDRWFFGHVLAFHASRHVARSLRPPAEEAALLDGMAGPIRAVLAGLRHGSMPVRTHAGLRAVCYREDVALLELMERLDRDLTMWDALLGEVARRIRGEPGKKGRKPHVTEHSIQVQTEKALIRLLPGKAKRTVVAHLTLRALQIEGIPAPSPDQRSPERAVRRVRRNSSK